MRTNVLLCALSLAMPLATTPTSLAAQKPANVERFEVAGLPKTPTTDLEKEIFMLLRVHKKGDLADATRIHMKLAEYYKHVGDNARAADCTKSAEAAWQAISGNTAPTSAASPGSPPFDPAGTFEGSFLYVDDLKVEHRWDFFVDGTYSHRITDGRDASVRPPTELGWYSVTGDAMRLWQLQPKSDRQVTFRLLDGNAVMNGMTMKPAK
ncbi:MAG: hypothetical protein U0163_10600 [Gemmatimonadaceae bacterium]